MKTKKVQFKLKGKKYDYDVVSFETLKEAQTLLAEDLLNVINLGNAVYAKSQALGKDPFKVRKTKYKIDITKLDAKTIEILTEAGAFLSERKPARVPRIP